MLLAGSHSSGKTLLAESFLKSLVKENDILRIDLSEYREYHTISKLIGTTAGYLGYDNKNNVFEKVRTNPSTAIIVDNFEQACNEVQKLFERILKNGIIEDASGKKIDFTNTMMIFTSTVENKNSALGFKKTNNEELSSLPNSLTKNVFVSIKLKELKDEEKEKIIVNKINSIIEDYDGVNVILPSSYKEDIISKLENKKDLNEIISSLENNLENQITDGLINYKRDIKITL